MLISLWIFFDNGSQLNLEGNIPATEVLVFMLVNLKGKSKCPIEYFFKTKLVLLPR